MLILQAFTIIINIKKGSVNYIVKKMSTFDTLTVVKRSGQRTNFQGEKIALAIQKAFHSLDIPYKD